MHRNTLKLITLWLALCVMLTACMPRHHTDTSPDIYHGFTRVDPDREQLVEDAFIVVEDGRIRDVGSGTPPRIANARLVDMRGLFALPGLIDAHAHITAGPHRVDVVDGAPVVGIESVDAITEFNARMALAFGITTVRNPGGDPEANARYDAHIADGTWIGPQAVHAGAVIQPPPFGGAAFAYPRTESEWHAEAARQAKLGMRYFKLYTDLSKDELATGIRVAHMHGMKAIAHLNAVSWADAAQLGIDGIEHTLPTSADLLEPTQRAIYEQELGADARYIFRWFELADFEGPLIQSMIEKLADRQVQVNTTLVVNAMTANSDDLERAFPLADRAYTHPQNLEAMMSFLQAGKMIPADHERARAVLPKALEFARRLHDAGVPILIGTDSNGGTPAYAHEMGLHVEAGIPVWEVLRLGTSKAASLLGLDQHTGRIAQGLDADIAFLRGNPVTDILHVRDVAFVVAKGDLHSFEKLTERDGSPEDKSATSADVAGAMDKHAKE